MSLDQSLVGTLDQAQAMSKHKHDADTVAAGGNVVNPTSITMGGDITVGANRVKFTNVGLKEVANEYLGVIRVSDDRLHYLETYALKAGHSWIQPKVNVDVNAKRFYNLRTFTTSPALADMSVKEVALGDGTGTGGLDEIFFKPDTAKIVALASDGSARTITS